MKFIIEDNEEEESEIKLCLIKEEEMIILQGEDKKGTIRYILNFKNGNFYRYPSAQLEGLKTDDKGRIEELE